MSKRKTDDYDDIKKKNMDDITQNLYTTSKDWPVYNHPEGGIIKITPWGSIRQIEVNGEVVTKFEDMTFNDYDFTPSINTSPISNTAENPTYHNDTYGSSYVDMPQTPQSIRSVKLSPGDDAEQYVMKGYENDQYAREPEHYFGMMDEDLDNDVPM